MRIFFRIVVAILALFILYFIFFYYQVKKADMEARRVSGKFRPDISALPDGKYSGRFSPSFKRFSAVVTFEIKGRQLGIIQFEELFGTPGYGAPQRTIGKIEETGNLDFDAVSGATITADFAKAAIRDAVENGPM
jgi:uncharacterized protein with FMN-binding domain